jgi:hypothetical protein
MNTRLRELEALEEARRQQSTPAETGVKVNGLEQVIEMLRYADPNFRASLIKRLHARDPKLAQQLLRFIR